MTEMLFLVSSARIRAFGPPEGGTSPKILRYEGKEDIAYETSRDIKDFLRYMLDNYGNGTIRRLSFVCQEADAVRACAEAGATLPCVPPLALYMLVYLLPGFCRKMRITSACAVTFAGRTWHIEGDSIETAEGHAACPLSLTEADVASLFFTSAPHEEVTRERDEAAPGVAAGELGKWVWRSNVEPKSSAGGKSRG